MIIYSSSAAASPTPSANIDLSDIRSRLCDVRPELDESSDEYRAAVLLQAGPVLKFNIDRLARRTRYAPQFVAMCARRLFDNGVWNAEGPVYCWDDPRDGRFWRDVEVAIGKSYRRCGADGRVEWGAVDAWRKKYDFADEADAPIAIKYVSDEDVSVARPQASTSAPPPPERRTISIVTPRTIAARHIAPAPAPAPPRVPERVAAETIVPVLFPDAKWL